MSQTDVLPKGSVDKLLEEIQRLPTIEKKSYLNDWLIHFAPNNPVFEKTDDDDILNGTIFVCEKPETNWRNLYLVGDSFGWDLPSYRFLQIKNTNWWYISFKRPRGARLHYLMSPNDPGTQITSIDRQERRKKWFFDTRNKFTVEDSKLHSVARFPGFTDEFKIPDKSPETHTLRLPKKLQGARSASYSILSRNGEKPNKLIFIHDAASAINYVHIDRILKAGIESGRWSSAVIVNLAINEIEREEEYGGRRGYPDYIADAVIPAVEEYLEMKFQPEDITIVGFALGAWAAFDVVWNRSDAVKNVICQSTPFWWCDQEDHHIENQYYLNEIKNSKKNTEIGKIYLDVGVYESGRDPLSTYDSNRKAADLLRKKKYNFMGRELLMGHRYQSWSWSLPGAFDYILNDIEEYGPLPGREIKSFQEK